MTDSGKICWKLLNHWLDVTKTRTKQGHVLEPAGDCWNSCAAALPKKLPNRVTVGGLGGAWSGRETEGGDVDLIRRVQRATEPQGKTWEIRRRQVDTDGEAEYIRELHH